LTPKQPGNLSERNEFCPAGVHLFGTGNLHGRRESVGRVLLLSFARTKERASCGAQPRDLVFGSSLKHQTQGNSNFAGPGRPPGSFFAWSKERTKETTCAALGI
jgi:hypothetical protein